MKFKVDENLSADLGALLRHCGHDADATVDENLCGAADAVIAGV